MPYRCMDKGIYFDLKGNKETDGMTNDDLFEPYIKNVRGYMFNAGTEAMLTLNKVTCT